MDEKGGLQPVRFDSRYDVALLQQVLAFAPHIKIKQARREAWEHVHADFQKVVAADGKHSTLRQCQDRLKYLVSKPKFMEVDEGDVYGYERKALLAKLTAQAKTYDGKLPGRPQDSRAQVPVELVFTAKQARAESLHAYPREYEADSDAELDPALPASALAAMARKRPRPTPVADNQFLATLNERTEPRGGPQLEQIREIIREELALLRKELVREIMAELRHSPPHA